MNALEQRLRRDAARLNIQVSDEVETRWRDAIAPREIRSRPVGPRRPFWAWAGGACVLALAAFWSGWELAPEERPVEPPRLGEQIAAWLASPQPMVASFDPEPLEAEAAALRRDIERARLQTLAALSDMRARWLPDEPDPSGTG